MTVDTYGGGAEVERFNKEDFGGAIPGLEGFDPSKMSIPRYTIDHEKGVFVDSLNNAEMETLDVVVLGMVPQRILWGEIMGDTDVPLCKSRNGDVGYPLLEANGKENLIFPFGDTAFDESSMGTDENENRTLSCAACSLREWGADKKPPRCNEQFTFVLCDEFVGGQALFTVQRTGITPARRYMSDFIRKKEAMFVVTTNISLREEKKAMGKSGGRKYQVPVFSRGERTDSGIWQEFAESYRGIREFVTASPRSGNTSDGDGSTEAASTSSTQAAATREAAATAPPANELRRPPARPATPAPVPAAAPAVPAQDSFTPATSDDDLPF